MFHFVVFKISVTIYILRQFSFHRGFRPIETSIYNIPIIKGGKISRTFFHFIFILLFNNKYISQCDVYLTKLKKIRAKWLLLNWISYYFLSLENSEKKNLFVKVQRKKKKNKINKNSSFQYVRNWRVKNLTSIPLLVRLIIPWKEPLTSHLRVSLSNHRIVSSIRWKSEASNGLCTCCCVCVCVCVKSIARSRICER